MSGAYQVEPLLLAGRREVGVRHLVVALELVRPQVAGHLLDLPPRAQYSVIAGRQQPASEPLNSRTRQCVASEAMNSAHRPLTHRGSGKAAPCSCSWSAPHAAMPSGPPPPADRCRAVNARCHMLVPTDDYSCCMSQVSRQQGVRWHAATLPFCHTCRACQVKLYGVHATCSFRDPRIFYFPCMNRF